MAKTTGPDTNPDELLQEGGGLREPQDLPVSPVDHPSAQKKNMGYNPDNIAEKGGLRSAGGKAKGAAAGMAVDKVGDKLGKGPEKNKGEAEKKIDKRAGQAAQAAVIAATGGAGTGTLSTVVGKVVEKVGTKRLAAISISLILIPIIVIGSLIAYVLNNPFGAISHVITDSSTRSFIANSADAMTGHQGLIHWAVSFTNAVGITDRFGGGVAVAASANKPEPGSFEYKISQIDWKRSQFKTLAKNDCPFDLQLVEVTNYDNKKISALKPLANDSNNTPSVINNQTGKTLTADEFYNNTEVGYCLSQKYPIFNMMTRQPIARDINTKVNLHLKYAAPKNSTLVTGDASNDKKYVYDKTLGRIASASSSSIKFSDNQKNLITEINKQYKFESDNYNNRAENKTNPSFIPVPTDDNKSDIPTQIQKMYDDMKKGTSPYDINISDYFNIPNIDDPATNNAGSVVAGVNIAEVMCPFVYGFMDIDNSQNIGGAESARNSIESRLSGAERDAMKFLTMDDTRKADDLNNSEGNFTVQQLDNWASSAGYQLDVYNNQNGVQMNPEGVHNRAYNANQNIVLDSNGALYKIQQACSKISRRNQLTPQEGVNADNDMVVAYKQLKEDILKESSGVFNSTKDIGLEQILTGYVRTGSITAVSGLEPGPDNYNRVTMGYKQLMNDYNLAIGGRFLTPDEINQISVRDESISRHQQAQNGIAYRLFNTNNIHSLASIFQQNTITKKTTLTALIGTFKSLLDPLRSLADINSNLTFYLTGHNNHAFAAGNTVNNYFKIDTAGFTQDELNIDPKSNADIIEGLKKNGSNEIKTKFTNYDECFKAKIPSSAYFQTAEDRYVPGQLDFVYFPDKHRSSNLNASDNSDSAKAFAKFSDCKFLLLDARDMNNPDQMLAIRYRLYRYFNTQLDILIALSSDSDNTSIYENPGALKQ